MSDGNENIRRKNQDIISESVRRWHHKSEGPGEPGGRTYDVLYASDGRILIDVSGCWSSVYHTVWLTADEVRPRAEWLAHLAATGRQPVEPRWCEVDGREIPAERIDREDPQGSELYCSTGCYVESKPSW